MYLSLFFLHISCSCTWMFLNAIQEAPWDSNIRERFYLISLLHVTVYKKRRTLFVHIIVNVELCFTTSFNYRFRSGFILHLFFLYFIFMYIKSGCYVCFTISNRAGKKIIANCNFSRKQQQQLVVLRL